MWVSQGRPFASPAEAALHALHVETTCQRRHLAGLAAACLLATSEETHLGLAGAPPCRALHRPRLAHLRGPQDMTEFSG